MAGKLISVAVVIAIAIMIFSMNIIESEAEKPFKAAGCPKNEANCNLLCKQKLGSTEGMGVCTGEDSFCECFKGHGRIIQSSVKM
ncbi:unnamed protein product [Orchesella dallaii]|uniref:Uncharacterized protein n=1 Tax=Orchesella dallaii TaxID=48710 RepID=A0ABP1R581_9HEXA